MNSVACSRRPSACSRSTSAAVDQQGRALAPKLGVGGRGRSVGSSSTGGAPASRPPVVQLSLERLALELVALPAA